MRSLYLLIVLFIFKLTLSLSANSAEYCELKGHPESKIWSYIICNNDERIQYNLARENFVREHITETTPPIKIDLYGTGKEFLLELFMERFIGPPGNVYDISSENGTPRVDFMTVGCLHHACSEKAFMITNAFNRKTLLGILHQSLNGKNNDNNEYSLINGGGHYLTLFSNDYQKFEDIKPRYVESILEYLSIESEYNSFIAYDPIIYFVGENRKLVEVKK